MIVRNISDLDNPIKYVNKKRPGIVKTRGNMELLIMTAPAVILVFVFNYFAHIWHYNSL
jgi:hypothetical protein